MSSTYHLKNTLGQNMVPSIELPPLDKEGKLILVPKAVIEVNEHTFQKRVIKEYLVKWKNLLMKDVTWESEQILQHLEL